MDSKVANRYVEILTYAIDIKVRSEGKNATFVREDIFNTISDITDKTYKKSIEWFLERNIFEKIGDTSASKYKINSKFSYKLSKTKDTIIRQCRFIIGQLGIYSDKLWDDTEEIYKDVVMKTNLYDFVPYIKEQSIKDTVSKILVGNYNDNNEGKYTYELLQTLISLKSIFNVKIKNSTLNIEMESVKLKKITFNTDTVTINFNNSKFEVSSLEDIKLIKVTKTNGLRERVDESLKLLEKYDTVSVKAIIDLLVRYQVKEDVCFKSL